MTLLAALLLATTLAGAEPDGIRRLAPAELHALVQEGKAVVIDVRGSVPYKYGHLAGAIWMPLGAVEQRAAELPQDRLIVAYCSCSHEETSLAAARALNKLGFEQTGVLVGGYPAWKEAGLPVEATAQPAAAPAAAPAGRLAPPEGLPCDRNHLTSYSGRVKEYVRAPERVTVTIDTTSDTTETVSVKGESQFLIEGKAFQSGDWTRIESAPGVLRPGTSVNAWVCEDGQAVLDWRPAPAP